MAAGGPWLRYGRRPYARQEAALDAAFTVLRNSAGLRAVIRNMETGEVWELVARCPRQDSNPHTLGI